MRKEKHYTHIDNGARIDFRLVIEKGKVVHFSINIAIITESGMEDVYRVDTAHKGLHEQRFWISSKPKYSEKTRKTDYTQDFNEKKREALENFARWVKLYKNKSGG